MTITITPRPSPIGFGAEISGLNLFQGVSDEQFKDVLGALDQYGVIVIRDQLADGRPVDEDTQLAFARKFGPLDASYRPKALQNSRSSSPYFGEVSNVDADGNVWKSEDQRRWFLSANYLWHSDTSYKKVPTWVTLLSAHEVPPVEGQTEFADMRAAYDDLPEAKKQELEELRAEHSIFHSREKMGFSLFSEEDRAAAPPVQQPLIRVNPRTGRKSLYLSSHASCIIGWPVEQGRKLLEELTDHATQPKYVFGHQWRVGDVVVWDNGATMHRARPFEEFKYRRVLKRTSVNEAKALL